MTTNLRKTYNYGERMVSMHMINNSEDLVEIQEQKKLFDDMLQKNYGKYYRKFMGFGRRRTG
jgi:hypothetical protein